VTGVLLLLFTVVAGAFLPLQAGVNARLARYVGGPVRASMVSFAVGAVALFLVVVLFYRSESHHASQAPAWAWVGGLLGAFYVTSTVVVPVRIGSAAFFGILVAAQLVTSVVLDRFGWIGFPKHDLSPLRLLGVLLLVGGAVLVRVF
jgi:bacterial/archaeal transporter family-2 protein